MADVKGAAAQLSKFKDLVAKGANNEAKKLLTALKIKLTEFTALPPLLQDTPTKDQERMIARDMLEHSIFLAVNLEDDTLFTRNFAQLTPYYTDLAAALPPSQQAHPILGLNLLRLLSQNRIAEFHVEVELLSREARASPHVEFPRELEQQLMEGMYGKLFGALSGAPSERMRPFLVQLQATVREELAACAAAAYDKLLLRDAAAALRFETQQELVRFCTAQGWKTDAQYVHFAAAAGGERGAQDGMGSFHNMLTYARELDSIV